jgi:two-component system chemotaxis response regulator CheB
MTQTVRVVVADDSPFVCRLLTYSLESDPAITVVKTVLNGKDAVEAVRELRPDVLTLDLDMPVMNGLDALRRIMADHPTSVVLISGLSKQAAEMTDRGLSLGAVDFILKYSPGVAVPPETLHQEIIAKVKAAAQIRVIRSIPPMESRFQAYELYAQPEIPPQPARVHRVSPLVIVGSSTGGPLALKILLSTLEQDFPFAMIIVQHMPEGFTATLAAQFDRLYPFPVREARPGEILTPGTVLVAPGDRHLIIRGDGSVLISKVGKIKGSRPSIDAAMQSAARTHGRSLTGVILSGMGTDGSEGMAAIRRCGGSTYAQSQETCVIASMPKAAVEEGVVQRIGSPAEIGSWLS